MNDYALYDVELRLLTPVHIGTGRELLRGYDYTVHGGQSWRLNEDALLAAQDIDDPALAAQLARRPPAELLDRARDFDPESAFYRYVVKGTPRSDAEGARVQEQIKDVYDRPYLPGSSLKGALRTALAWVAWEERGLRPERGKLRNNARFAAQNYERDLFGRDPNHDLLRALHVADSAPTGTDRLMLVNAQVLHRGGAFAAPVELEAIQPDTVLRMQLKVDRALFSEWAGRDRLQGGEWLGQLPAVVRRHTAQRLEEEAAWYTGVENARAIAELYRGLQRATLPEDAFLLQVGWGTGWDDKTLGSHLRADPGFMEGILAPRREGGYGIARGRRQRGDPFPKSRRVLVSVQRGPGGRVSEQPQSPLGWVVIQLAQRQAALCLSSVSEAREFRPEEEPEREAPRREPAEAEPPREVTEEVVPRDTAPEEGTETPSGEEPPAPPSVTPGRHTGTVSSYNYAQGKGVVAVDGSEVELPVRASQLRSGVRYLAQGQRVSFTVVEDEGGVHVEDVGPAS